MRIVVLLGDVYSRWCGEPEEVYDAGSERDDLESWMLAAPDARPFSQATLRDIVADYLASHGPFPDGMSVEVARRDGSGWELAVVMERPDTDEWTVEYDDGTQAWRDHSELRPRRQQSFPPGPSAAGEICSVIPLLWPMTVRSRL
jgi:hypothetical protein